MVAASSERAEVPRRNVVDLPKVDNGAIIDAPAVDGAARVDIAGVEIAGGDG